VRDGTSLQPLSALTNLQEQTQSGPLTDAMLTGLGPLPVLRYLSLNPHFQNMTRGLSDKTLEHVAQFALLEKLACYHDGPFSDAGLAHLARLTNLKSLVFPNCDRFTEVGIQRLSQLQSLEELELRGNGLTDAGLAHIAGLRNLGRLALHDTVAVTDAGMAALRSHPSLKRLQLYSPHIITTVGVNHLNTVTNFVELEIEEFRSLDDVPLDFSKLEHLEKLHITGCRSHDLAGLASLKRLKHLTVGNVTGEGLRHISRIAALEQLSVLNQINRLTDADLAPLADVTRLTSLTISGDFTAAGLRHLAALKGLTYLKVEKTKQITADERSELQDSHPCLRYASFTTKKP
jgi:Leucine-rich repeat (LRR) protein